MIYQPFRESIFLLYEKSNSARLTVFVSFLPDYSVWVALKGGEKTDSRHLYIYNHAGVHSKRPVKWNNDLRNLRVPPFINLSLGAESA